MLEASIEVGQQIKQLRITKGLTLKEAGAKMGVSEATFSRYETGKQNLTLETIAKISTALGAKMKITFDIM